MCTVDVAKSSKLQDADWLGKVLNAARTGDAAGMKKLLQDENAKAKLKKLRKPVEVCCEAADRQQLPAASKAPVTCM